MEHDSRKWKYRPNMLNLEPVQGCNFECPFCGSMGVEDGIHLADLKVFEHVIKLLQDAHLNCAIRLAAHGEPTLHPQIAEIVGMLRKGLPKSPITMFTNGTVIEKRPELIDRLFEAGLNNMIVDEYRGHPMRHFIKAHCPDYQVVYQEKGEKLFDATIKSKRIIIVPPLDMSKQTMARNFHNHLGAGMPPLKEPMHKKCSCIFREMTIWHDGSIAICSNDFRGYYKVCNIMECDTFEKAWFHERLESARKILFTANRGFFPCELCNAKPIRPGLLPDWGQKKCIMEKPTKKDWEIVNRRTEPLAKIKKRPWEK